MMWRTGEHKECVNIESKWVMCDRLTALSLVGIVPAVRPSVTVRRKGNAFAWPTLPLASWTVRPFVRRRPVYRRKIRSSSGRTGRRRVRPVCGCVCWLRLEWMGSKIIRMVKWKSNANGDQIEILLRQQINFATTTEFSYGYAVWTAFQLTTIVFVASILAVDLSVAFSACADALASVALIFARSATLLAAVFVRSIRALELTVAFGA